MKDRDPETREQIVQSILRYNFQIIEKMAAMVQYILPTDKDTPLRGFILLMGKDNRRVVQISLSQRKYDSINPRMRKSLSENKFDHFIANLCNALQLK